jgi:hypothetical protein
VTNLIKKLHNPKTKLYYDFKHHILSEEFPWFYLEHSTPNLFSENYSNVPFYSHSFLLRPEDTQFKLPEKFSDFVDTAHQIFLEILHFNRIPVNCFFRMNANCVQPTREVLNTVPHIDHPFEHNNLIVYLTSSGGSTIVGNESHSPNEDDVILFGGETHYIQTPQEKRRVILVATFV